MSTAMRWNSGLIAILLMAGTCSGTSLAQDQVVHVSATDWPPYTTEKLPRGGAMSVVVRAAFGRTGRRIEVFYDTWPKAIELARKGTHDVAAYYPGYHCRHRSGFTASNPIGHGPLGFAEHIDAPLVWESLDDIGEKKLKIGTVNGYANTDEFDNKVGTGWIHAIPSRDDTTSLQKLLRKRLDAAVIDRFVLDYLKATDQSLRDGGDKLRFNSKMLENKTFYLCFRNTDDGNRLKEEFNRGLQEIDVKRIAADYFAKAFSK